MDVRDRWAGIRALTNDYSPQPYTRRDQNGRIVGQQNRAETAAEYLANQHWGIDEKSHKQTFRKSKIVTGKHPTASEYNERPIQLPELRAVVNKLKRNKAPGPDGITTKQIKELL